MRVIEGDDRMSGIIIISSTRIERQRLVGDWRMPVGSLSFLGHYYCWCCQLILSSSDRSCRRARSRDIPRYNELFDYRSTDISLFYKYTDNRRDCVL